LQAAPRASSGGGSPDDENEVRMFSPLERDARVHVAGHRGLVGGAVWRYLLERGHTDGTPRKLLDVRRINALDWRPATSLVDGIRATWQWFRRNHTQAEHESLP